MKARSVNLVGAKSASIKGQEALNKEASKVVWGAKEASKGVWGAKEASKGVWGAKEASIEASKQKSTMSCMYSCKCAAFFSQPSSTQPRPSRQSWPVLRCGRAQYASCVSTTMPGMQMHLQR